MGLTTLNPFDNATAWQQLAARSPVQTAVAVERSLRAGEVDRALVGIEELIDALTRSERRSLKSQLVRLMAHVIKWRTQPGNRSRSWLATIQNAREEIRDIQEETPSLTDGVIREMWDRSLVQALRQAEGEMDQESTVDALTWDEVIRREYLLEE